MLSVCEKEKLQDWDAVVRAEESANSPSKSEEQVDVMKAALSVLVRTELSQDGALLFISVFLPCVVSFSAPEMVPEIRTSNSALC